MNVNLDRHDVISVDGGKTLLSARTFTVSEVAKVLGEKYVESRQGWFNEEGIECHVLQQFKGWTKGRARITVEFIPDKEDSPLDDLRKKVNEVN